MAYRTPRISSSAAGFGHQLEREAGVPSRPADDAIGRESVALLERDAGGLRLWSEHSVRNHGKAEGGHAQLPLLYFHACDGRHFGKREERAGPTGRPTRALRGRDWVGARGARARK